MKFLFKDTDYNKTIELAKKLTDKYDKPVIFHCYWYGDLNEKHLYSVRSCYYWNALNRNHKIILWLENNTPNDINKEISKYCEIKYFDFNIEKQTLNYARDIKFKHNKRDLTEYADFIRLILLYNYGGCWFDLDCFFLRSLDPIFKNYEKEICAYQWEYNGYPNNAILISLEPRSSNMKNSIDFFHNQNTGWRTQHNCTYSSPLDWLVLPCSWFDPDWIENPYNKMRPTWNNRLADIRQTSFFKKTEKKYTFDNFFNGVFCYHWHNKWKLPIEDNSIIKQLTQLFSDKS